MRGSPTMPAQTLTKNQMCTAQHPSCYTRVLHRPQMGVMCVEYSFLTLVKDASSVNNTLVGETGICSALFKIPLNKSNTRCIITLLKYLNTLHVIQVHFIISDNPPDTGTVNPDFVYSNWWSTFSLMSGVCADCVRLMAVHERNLFQLTSSAALRRNYGWEGVGLVIGYRSAYKHCATGPLQPASPVLHISPIAYRFTLCSYN